MTTLPADYHLHTPLCRHATGEPSALAAVAVARGLPEIGFSDHNPMPRDDFDDWRMRLDQLDGYVDAVARARHDHPTLVVRLGLEVDYLPDHEDWIRDLAARHPWDYFIGSVHYIDRAWDIDNPAKVSRWRNRDPFEVWTLYFERLTQAAASRLFDIIGHADLCKKFGFRPARDWLPLAMPFLDATRAAGAALEINTAGLRKDCAEMYPNPQLLAAAASLGIPITFGSDAHAPGEVGADFDRAVAFARQTGYTHALRFQRRRSTPVPL
ncbi:MAG TPA: histidinol-phosphatase HisJ family protein [Verrucomicrobiota bacterium]|nr:histidinol-phosphatase HisJ family protein [Verrucomicrobiota bacterium]HNU51439.1 histidinol-phosphatase HisJ family protein [Verrucomicrobiota bacterium]